MRNFWKEFAVVILAFLVNSCDIGEDEVNYHFVTLQVLEVDMPEAFRLNETYEVGVTVLEPNDCTHFDGFNISSEALTVRQVVPIGTELDDQVCAEVISRNETSFEFTCLYSEPYLFRFWTGENEEGVPQYLEIEVPVIP